MPIYYRHGPYDGVIEDVKDIDIIVIELPYSVNKHKYIWTPRFRYCHRIYQYMGICELIKGLDYDSVR